MNAAPEQRSHVDITPGLLYYDVRNPNKNTFTTSLDRELFESGGPWLVIHKLEVSDAYGNRVYLCLGPGPVLVQRTIRWIVRAFDPKFEEHR